MVRHDIKRNPMKWTQKKMNRNCKFGWSLTKQQIKLWIYLKFCLVEWLPFEYGHQLISFYRSVFLFYFRLSMEKRNKQNTEEKKLGSINKESEFEAKMKERKRNRVGKPFFYERRRKAYTKILKKK